MLPEIAVVVPTYWTRAGGSVQPGDSVYDHPTPLDAESTLPRLLDSLEQLDQARFYLLIVLGLTAAEVESAAIERLRAMLEEHPRIQALLAASPEVDLARSVCPEATDLVGLFGYSAIRNLQLALPLALGAEFIVALDDDEEVVDPQFLDTAVEAVGTRLHGKTVDGSSGYYLQDQTGRITLDVPPGSEWANNVFDRKAAIMNSATEALEEKPERIVPTNFCFGGNMVFSRSLAQSIFFDPSCMRGEDIDYLINARLEDRWFFMNKSLRVLHAPPAGGSYQDVAHHKVVQDVSRFVYEREKLKAWRDIGGTHPVEVADLLPYPGAFLTEDLDTDALAVLRGICAKTDDSEREVLGLEAGPEQFLERVKDKARAGVALYPARRDVWTRLTGALSSGSVGAQLEQRMVGAKAVGASGSA